ncbi:hypothetical protein RCH11_003718, partial [Glaciihabitans sp. GrIS 2.15]|nr:hypothetical protein [Glaciihabitans sp. GrIS 2.15]
APPPPRQPGTERQYRRPPKAIFNGPRTRKYSFDLGVRNIFNADLIGAFIDDCFHFSSLLKNNDSGGGKSVFTVGGVRRINARTALGCPGIRLIQVYPGSAVVSRG